VAWFKVRVTASTIVSFIADTPIYPPSRYQSPSNGKKSQVSIGQEADLVPEPVWMLWRKMEFTFPFQLSNPDLLTAQAAALRFIDTAVPV
jgi:hypothetical protein